MLNSLLYYKLMVDLDAVSMSMAMPLTKAIRQDLEHSPCNQTRTYLAQSRTRRRLLRYLF